MVGVALALMRRGHRVAFATGSEFEEAFQEAGIERIPRGARDGPSFGVERWGEALDGVMQVKHLEYALHRFSPDVLVGHQLALGPLIAADVYDLPVAVLGLGTYLWPKYTLRDRAPESESERRVVWRYGEMLRRYNEMRAALRLPHTDEDWWTTPMVGDLFLLQSVPDLEGNEDLLPSQVHLIGACLWESTSPDSELTQWLTESHQNGAQIVYVQPGRFFDTPSFWPVLIESLGSRDVRVAVSAERMDRQLGVLPDNFFVQDHIPQGLVLPHAHAMVSGANTTSVLGAITHGVPSLLIPGGGEQPDLAERCETAGVAKLLSPYEMSAEIVWRELVSLLASEPIREAGQNLARIFRQYDGCEYAAELLTVLGATRSVVNRKARDEGERLTSIGARGANC
jgi:UDP:flavonoid glycosyltransferase YjiC (YdhE family)